MIRDKGARARHGVSVQHATLDHHKIQYWQTLLLAIQVVLKQLFHGILRECHEDDYPTQQDGKLSGCITQDYPVKP